MYNITIEYWMIEALLLGKLKLYASSYDNLLIH